MTRAYGTARDRLWKLLGGAPGGDRPAIAGRRAIVVPIGGCSAERLELDLGGGEPVPALFLRPEGAARPPLVLYCHAHGNDYDLGKRELLEGRRALQSPYAAPLVEAGCAVLAIDNWLFGERPRHGGESAFAKGRLYAGDTVFGMMLRDNYSALTLAIRELAIDESRIAALGLSMGASLGWWLAALDERVKVCVDICCMTEFETAIETGGIDGHGIYYVVPGLLKSFSTASINALIAPRAHLSLNGRRDPLTPEAGLLKVDDLLRRRYAALGVPERWRMEIHDCGHEETPAMRTAALEFLARWL